MIIVWHYNKYALDSEYARVLNMAVSYTRLWIKFPIIDIWQGSEYVSSSDYANATQGSVENDRSYMFDRVLRIPRVINVLGLEFTRVVNMTRLQKAQCKFILKIHGILNLLNSEYAEVPNLSGV